jgi:hypothetical protein
MQVHHSRRAAMCVPAVPESDRNVDAALACSFQFDAFPDASKTFLGGDPEPTIPLVI